MAKALVSHLLSMFGAALGGVAGFLLFRWLLSQNLYGMIIPGALLGLGCQLLSLEGSKVRGGVCALGAVALGIYTEWSFFPFLADDGFLYFLAHLGELKPITQIMLAAGGLLSYLLGRQPSPFLQDFARRKNREPPSRDLGNS